MSGNGLELFLRDVDVWYYINLIPNVIFSIDYANYVKGPFACELYGMFGSLFGVTSIWTMVFIALDRYNVIVKVKIKIKHINIILYMSFIN